MKYFQVIGNSTAEVANKILKEYNGRAYIIKLSKETKEVQETKKWFHIGPLKPKKSTHFFYRAYCSLPENPEDVHVIQDLQAPPAVKEEGIEFSKETTPVQERLELKPPQEEEKNYHYDLQMQADISHLKEVVGHLYHQSQESQLEEKFLPFLLSKGFSYNFSHQFLDSLQTHISDEAMLKLILREKLRMKIPILEQFQFQPGENYLFLGSTGVGKTTTLAKMAAICYRQGLSQFQFVSFDSYRLGADEQLKRFADIFEKPFTLIQNEEEMKGLLKKKKKNEILFLDTAGESIQQEIKIPEVLKYLNLIKDPVKVFLVLSAHSKLDDLDAIKEQFKKFDINAYIITKLDETKTLGSILEFLSSQDTKVAFYTDGQAVPNDIKVVLLEKFFEYI